MARKDRERARQRHAVDRARREQGIEPKPKSRPADSRPETGTRRATGRPASGTSPRANGARPAAGPAEARRPFQKAKAGELDPRGRVRERSMLVDPRITLVVIVLAMVVVVLSLVRFRHALWLPYVGFAIAALGFADLAYKKRHSVLWLGGAVVATGLAVQIAVTGK